MLKSIPVAILTCALWCWPAAGRTTFDITPITIDGTTNVNAYALNNRGMSAGTVCPPSGCQGYIDTGSTVSFLPPPDANCNTPCLVSPTSIDADGDVVGYFYDGIVSGFRWSAGAYVNGGFVNLGTGAGLPATIAVNRHGEEVFDVAAGDGSFVPYAGMPGNFLPVAPPGSFPFVTKVNEHGAVAGQYSPAGSAVFTEANGVYTTIVPPGALDSSQGTINDGGQVAGLYHDQLGVTHGFVEKNAHFHRFDLPGSPSVVTLADINNQGHVVGVFTDPLNGGQRVFLYNGSAVSVFGTYSIGDVVHVAINDFGTLLVSVFSDRYAVPVYESYRVRCSGPAC